MAEKKAPGKARRMTHMKVLAIAFLLAIFYIGSATFPSTVTNISHMDPTHGLAAIYDAQNKINKDYSDMLDFKHSNFKNKASYINMNGLMARLMGQRYINERVKLNNGHLGAASMSSAKQAIGAEIEVKVSHKKNREIPAVLQMAKLNESQNDKGKVLLFVMAPNQNPKYEDVLPTGYAEGFNRNADNLLDGLSGNGVPFLDLREEMKNDGIGHSEAFFVTDHHWKPETGFWAYAKTIAYLETASAIEPVNPVLTDINEFDIDVYKDVYLGSSGKRTGRYFAGLDDFSVITPKFKTDMSLEIPSSSISRQGGFAEVAYSHRDITIDFFNTSIYSIYGHGNRDLMLWRNDAAPIDLKVLALGDSFSNVYFTFFPLVFTTFDQMDLRQCEEGFDFLEYYSAFDPDIVIIQVNASSISNPNTTYDFFNDLQDEGATPGSFGEDDSIGDLME